MCWGDNLYGQLGDGTNIDSSVPVDVVGLRSGVTRIAAGYAFSCALMTAGGVKCWGNNPFGALGNGTTADSSVPVDVSGLASGVSAIAAGGRHACALKSGGGLSCWGEGQSDDDTLVHSSVPVAVSGLASGIAAIAAGNDHTCVLTNGGGVMCRGPYYEPPPAGGLPWNAFVPIDVANFAGGVTAIAIGDTSRCVLTSAGVVACWGSNDYGQLSRSPSTGSVVPVQVGGLPGDVTAVAAGGMHVCALTGVGEVMCWGSNYFGGADEIGVLGNGTTCDSSSVPVEVQINVDGAAPQPSSEPTRMPIGRFDHATGPTDVVLRLDRFPYVAVGELGGELFQPGPEFTLYGDGTVIFRNKLAPPPPAEGPIVRANPFMIAHLDEEKIQSILRFAIRGGLGEACELYLPRFDTDAIGSTVFTLRAVGLDKRVEIRGAAPFQALVDYLAAFGARDGLSTEIWVPTSYIGSLLNAGPAIEIGVLPDPREAGIVPWPWPDIAPEDFVVPADPGWEPPRRVLSPREAAVLGLSNNGGVVQRMYVRSPDGKAIYSFSLWPRLPDATE